MFLTIVTWTFQRPSLLKKQQESLAMQTCQDFEQVVTVDNRGIGIPAVHMALRTTECKGRYLWIFDDDDIITDKTFIEKLKKIADEDNPDVIVAPMQRDNDVIGNRWPWNYGEIGSSNPIVRRDIWYKYRGFYGARSGGDWDWIEAMSRDKLKVHQIKEVMQATQRVSRGRTEEETSRIPNIGEKVVILEGCGSVDYMFSQGEEWTIDEKNAKILNELVRCGRAEYKDRPFRLKEVKTGD